MLGLSKLTLGIIGALVLVILGLALTLWVSALYRDREELEAKVQLLSQQTERLNNSLRLQDEALKRAALAAQERAERLKTTEEEHEEFVKELEATPSTCPSWRLPDAVYNRLRRPAPVPAD